MFPSSSLFQAARVTASLPLLISFFPWWTHLLHASQVAPSLSVEMTRHYSIAHVISDGYSHLLFSTNDIISLFLFLISLPYTLVTFCLSFRFMLPVPVLVSLSPGAFLINCVRHLAVCETSHTNRWYHRSCEQAMIIILSISIDGDQSLCMSCVEVLPVTSVPSHWRYHVSTLFASMELWLEWVPYHHRAHFSLA